ncbi:hypothetical protein GGS21DRAFT_457624 [Xylaria nigripes]|nr:hypothetical protein GGS21DRAFT_457624 [Xylaria nigripes]
MISHKFPPPPFVYPNQLSQISFFRQPMIESWCSATPSYVFDSENKKTVALSILESDGRELSSIYVMAGPQYRPPAGQQARPRRKSLEQLEAKYKALMRKMLMYQYMKKEPICMAAGTGTGIGVETGASNMERGLIRGQLGQHETPSSISPDPRTASIEDVETRAQSPYAPNPHPVFRGPKPQKRLQSGPKPAYDSREPHPDRPRGPGSKRKIPASVQFAYEELAPVQPPSPLSGPGTTQPAQQSGLAQIQQHAPNMECLQQQYLPRFQPLETPYTPPPALPAYEASMFPPQTEESQDGVLGFFDPNMGEI